MRKIEMNAQDVYEGQGRVRDSSMRGWRCLEYSLLSKDVYGGVLNYSYA